ncbi:hypothetical protein BZA05DRAFT_203928 [Tricharina praecox]|uniref:uncharacterized protein n=1 Tax=Tricharina praecox TaxID=43433 RepID=UPI00221F0D35|nr:uncharacterized protein BZA05DRAFT_203928 [Tricharina praecox]KAI5856534.1 hypothetical protein BZA05DRAFT_203928 [Tricharina praecox]
MARSRKPTLSPTVRSRSCQCHRPFLVRRDGKGVVFHRSGGSEGGRCCCRDARWSYWECVPSLSFATAMQAGPCDTRFFGSSKGSGQDEETAGPICFRPRMMNRWTPEIRNALPFLRRIFFDIRLQFQRSIAIPDFRSTTMPLRFTRLRTALSTTYIPFHRTSDRIHELHSYYSQCFSLYTSDYFRLAREPQVERYNDGSHGKEY